MVMLLEAKLESLAHHLLLALIKIQINNVEP